jgi:hypothetical protein
MVPVWMLLKLTEPRITASIKVRELREDCQYAPTQCSYKIYIIDEVHMLSTAAFNALLKTLGRTATPCDFHFCDHGIAQGLANDCLPLSSALNFGLFRMRSL